MDRWLGKNVCVMGLGRSGKATINLLLQRGASVVAFDDSDMSLPKSEISSYERRGVTFIFDSSNEQSLGNMGFDLIVVSPGIAFDHPLVKRLDARGVPIWSELELGWRETKCPSIAVTGTNGKTTTVEWIDTMLSGSGLQTVAVGNIGLPLSEVAKEPKTQGLDAVVLEVSSFQLERIDKFKPDVAVMLNLAEDHLDRHRAMENYIRTKARIFEMQEPDDNVVIQWESWQQLKQSNISVAGQIATFSTEESSADLYLDGNLIVSRLPDWPKEVLNLDDCILEGKHQAANLMAVLLVGRAMRLPLESMIEIGSRLQAGPHRCEMVAESNGVRFYNDSKATNTHALCSALQAMPESAFGSKNIWLIAGGQGKEFDFRRAVQDLERRVKGVFLIGETAAEIQHDWEGFVTCNLADNLVKAVAEAGRNAVPGDVVLLSPACASFDMFDSYQHRGETYRTTVAQWIDTMACD